MGILQNFVNAYNKKSNFIVDGEYVRDKNRELYFNGVDAKKMKNESEYRKLYNKRTKMEVVEDAIKNNRLNPIFKLNNSNLISVSNPALNIQREDVHYIFRFKYSVMFKNLPEIIKFLQEYKAIIDAKTEYSNFLISGKILYFNVFKFNDEKQYDNFINNFVKTEKVTIINYLEYGEEQDEMQENKEEIKITEEEEKELEDYFKKLTEEQGSLFNPTDIWEMHFNG